MCQALFWSVETSRDWKPQVSGAYNLETVLMCVREASQGWQEVVLCMFKQTRALKRGRHVPGSNSRLIPEAHAHPARKHMPGKLAWEMADLSKSEAGNANKIETLLFNLPSPKHPWDDGFTALMHRRRNWNQITRHSISMYWVYYLPRTVLCK